VTGVGRLRKRRGHFPEGRPFLTLYLRGIIASCDNEVAMKNSERITVDPAQMGGVPCIRHLRIPVATVLRLLAG